MKRRVLVVDDELPARQRLEDLIAGQTDFTLSGSLDDGRDAVTAISKDKPDLVRLDIQMPGLSGFEVVREVGPEHMPTTIFVTAYDRFALSAFELCALDYLLKPFDDERFFQALKRARQQIRLMELESVQEPMEQLFHLLQTSGLSANPRPKYLERLPVKTRKEVLLVPVEDIAYIAAQGQYCELHTSQKNHLIRSRMHELETQLDPRIFFRIHRSTLVNLRYVKSLKPYFRDDYVVVMRDGPDLRLSRGRREALQQRLGMAF